MVKNMVEMLIVNFKFKFSENYDNIFMIINNSEIIFSFCNNISEGGQNLYVLFIIYNLLMKGSWFFCLFFELEKLFEDLVDMCNNICIIMLESVFEIYIIMNKFRDFMLFIVLCIVEMYLISVEV